MVTWQTLSKQAEKLSWREIAPQGYRQRLALIWQLVRSLLEGTMAAYADARTKAQAETGLPIALFPAELPFTWEQAMTEDLTSEAV